MSLADDSPLTFSSATEIGFALQQHREKKQISLDVAAGELRLSPRQVANLEAGQFTDFRSAVFVKGYLRTCAKMYGLDGDALVRAYERVAPQIEAAPNSSVTKARRVVISAPSQTKKYWVVAAALLLIAVAGAAYWQWVLRENVMVATPASETVSGQVDLPDIGVVGSVVGGVEPPAMPVTAVAPAALPVPAVEVSQDAVLHMEFSDDCWVQIKDESGKILHEKNQRKGDVLDMTVSPPLRVWLGRAGAANVSYNGVLVAVPVKVGYQSAQFVLGDDTQSDRVE